MAAVIPPKDACRLQLAAFAGNEPASSFLEVRPLDPPARQRFFGVRDLAGATASVLELADRHNVYVGVSPRVRERGGKADVERCWCLWADCDNEQAVERARTFEPSPAVIVLSGSPGHAHCYWPLRESLTPAHAVRANKRLAFALGADMRSTDIARVLRPAGTINHKGGERRPVVCERLELVAYLARDVVGQLADPIEQNGRCLDTSTHSRSTLPAVVTHHDDPLRDIPAADYIEALTGRAVGRDGKVRCPFHGGGGERTPSLHVYSDGWACFGCEAPAGRDALGGDIYTFAAILFGIPGNGARFRELRDRLLHELDRSVAA